MECVGKTCRAANRVRRLPEKFVSWSWRRDSNPRPSDYKSDALPTELRQQIPGKDAPSRKLIPLIPARCPGQLVKVSQAELSVQPIAGYRLPATDREDPERYAPLRNKVCRASVSEACKPPKAWAHGSLPTLRLGARAADSPCVRANCSGRHAGRSDAGFAPNLSRCNARRMGQDAIISLLTAFHAN